MRTTGGIRKKETRKAVINTSINFAICKVKYVSGNIINIGIAIEVLLRERVYDRILSEIK